MLHHVYFWLKKDLTDADRTLFETELKRLPEISYICSGFAGKPAPTEHRDGVTDQTFDYSLSLEFTSMKDHLFYQTDCPDHTRFVDTCKPFFERITVYDSDRL